MRKLFILLFFVFSISYAQVPQKMSHRGTAYNTSGQILSNTQIKVRVKIFDGSTSGTLLFEEIHNNNLNNLQTNQNGQYSIEIGNGTQQGSNAFSSIDWATNSPKWLEIGIASSTSPNTFVTGSSQLMSVPYALYSEKSNTDIKTVNNISDLRAITSFVDKQMVFVKGYYSEGDGGDGFFIFLSDEVVPDTHGIHIKPDSLPSTSPGRWVRQYSGPINVIYFGVVKVIDQIMYEPPTLPKNAERLNNAIEYVNNYNLAYNFGNQFSPPQPLKKTPQDMTIYFPSGSYWLDETIYLYKNINLVGDEATRLTPYNFANQQNKYLFETKEGFIERVNIQNFEIDFSQATNGLGGIYFNAQDPSSSIGGGSWLGTFKKIKMVLPTGHGIYLKGQDYSAGTNTGINITEWNQYLHFEDIFIERQNGYSNNCLKIEGANVNISFENCNFAIPYIGTGNYQESDSGTNVCITSSGQTITVKPAQISFINCATGGGNRKGVYNAFKIENSENINLTNCWFEDTEIAVIVKNSKAINIQNSRFANTAGVGSQGISDLSNYSIASIDVENSFINVNNNYFAVSFPDAERVKKQLFIFGRGQNNTINVSNNSFSDIRVSNSYGITQNITITNVDTFISTNPTISGINTDGKNTAIVNVPFNSDPTTNQIFRINSTIAAGETISIRADQGTITFWSWNPENETTGKNIYINGRNSLTLNNGQIATFIKLDGVNGNEKCVYQLLSVDKVNVTSSFSFTGSTIDSASNSYIYVSTTTPNTVVNEFKSNLNPGETLTIKAINTIRFNSTKNLLISTLGSLVLNPNETATFMRTGLPVSSNGTNYTDSWQLVSTNRENTFSTATTTTTGGSTTTILRPTGTYTLPAASSVPIGTTYVIRNTSTGASNLTVSSFINYNATTSASFLLTPTIGTISVVSDGVNWYRVN